MAIEKLLIGYFNGGFDKKHMHKCVTTKDHMLLQRCLTKIMANAQWGIFSSIYCIVSYAQGSNDASNFFFEYTF